VIAASVLTMAMATAACQEAEWATAAVHEDTGPAAEGLVTIETAITFLERLCWFLYGVVAVRRVFRR